MNDQNSRFYTNLFANNEVTSGKETITKRILDVNDDCSDASVTQDQMDCVPVIELVDSEEPTTKSEDFVDEVEEVMQPVRKTKRRRRITIEDISKRPITRSSQLKLKTLHDIEA